ncbi:MULTISPECIES: ribonuclease III [Enterocloster]|uniref:Ribonuclease 3 n=3 Tax=Enterocloster TaxID=2719313 RepID=A0A1I0B7V3_9FIRM|nr:MULTISPECIES: ribonuclease III [Enterocloster]RHR57220.1 ribonuclease III [Clostridium sp. AF18-27]EEG51826.1 ribonuclease III [[Clostridium] asparagiforme DSM 15981]MBS5607245.1 ribonuclease III [Enterocloster asparagiformis]MCB6341932.1 ribonuclease III [Enterocloster lavalensis]MDR3759340.1 ribonuclease III [Enterocloster sp.]
MNRNLQELERTICYQFKEHGLFVQALTHSSYANEHRWNHSRCNERLEFLGDAVLEIVTSDFLYHKYEDLPEGDLTKIRASIVCEPTLAYCAGDISLGEYLLLGKGEEATGGRSRNSVVSDAMEALIGAIYLDGGFANAKEFIHRFILNDIEHKQLFYDSKTILQEMVQSRSSEGLSYEILREEGPDHNKSFEVCARIGGAEIGRGTGRTKKAAEQVAAYNGILKLKAEEEKQ